MRFNESINESIDESIDESINESIKSTRIKLKQMLIRIPPRLEFFRSAEHRQKARVKHRVSKVSIIRVSCGGLSSGGVISGGTINLVTASSSSDKSSICRVFKAHPQKNSVNSDRAKKQNEDDVDDDEDVAVFTINSLILVKSDAR